MVKAITSAIAFCSVCFIGIFINKRKKQRLAFYKDYQKYLLLAFETVRSVKGSKNDINQRISSSLGADFNKYLNDSVLPRYIGNNEGNDIKDFFDKFGASDYQATIDTISRERLRIDEVVMGCETDVKNKGGMIMKLCILGGIAIVILII